MKNHSWNSMLNRNLSLSEDLNLDELEEQGEEYYESIKEEEQQQTKYKQRKKNFRKFT